MSFEVSNAYLNNELLVNMTSLFLFSAIPKDVVIIHIHLDDGVILKSFGRQLSVRPVERTVKKFKNVRIVQL